MATFQAPSVVPGAIDAFGQAYDRATASRHADASAAIANAVGLEKLREATELGDTRRALPNDIAAIAAARFGATPPSPPTVMPPPDVAGALGQMPDQATTPPADAAAAGLAGQVAPGPTALVPPEAASAPTSTGVTLGMLTNHPDVGPERMARLMRTPEGQVALKARGFVDEETFNKRQLRREAKDAAVKKYAEAQQLYQSGNPDDVLQALNVEAAAHTLLAQAVDNPDRLLGKADDLRKKYLDAADKKDERARVGTDMPRLFSAFQKWKDAQSDPKADQAAASADLFGVLGGMKSKTGQHRADEIASKIAEGLISEVKTSPTAGFDRAVAAVIGERRDKGGEIALNGVFQDAAKKDPAAFSQYLSYVMTHGKEIPKPLLSMLGVGDVPTDPVHMADQIVVQVENIPRGSAQYYQRLRTVTKEITQERNPQFKSEDRKTESMDRDAAVRLHKQLQDQVKEAQKAFKDAGGEGVASPDLADEVTSSRERLRAHEADMTSKKYLAPTVRDAGKEREAQAPPARATKDAAKAEIERLMGLGDSLEAAKAKMKKKGWQ